ncbi:MFS transporter [Allorhizocola rhizosphaerae]|uniref:MFS transporter n=1 Tax=Allorhizocola rhizosphaerae TaxID=1872709 RepID=UPI000E3DC07C|nr:MFS transporter [Allorhizocola rhizosphaerae]
MKSFRRDLALLRERRFALLLTARTIVFLGGAFTPVALAFGVLDLPGATAKTLSVVLAAEAIPMVLFLLAGGVIADRFPRNRVIMLADLLVAFSLTAIATMMFTGWTPLPALAAACVLLGTASAVAFPAMTGIIPEVVPADKLQPANALIGFAGNTARIFGIVAAGALVALVGGAWALLIGGVLYACGALTIGSLGGTFGTGSRGHSVLADLRQGWREFASREWLWVVVLQFSVLVMAFQAAHGVLGPVVAQQELGGAAAWSAVLAGFSVGTLVGVVFSMRIRPKRPILVATFTTIPMSAPYLLIGVGAPLWMVVAGAVVQGICFDIFGVLWQTTMQREIPAESLSRVSSYDALGSLMFGPIGLMLAGPVAIAVGPKPALVVASAIIAFTGLAALLSPGVRNLRAREVEPEPAQPGVADQSAGSPVVSQA